MTKNNAWKDTSSSMKLDRMRHMADRWIKQHRALTAWMLAQNQLDNTTDRLNTVLRSRIRPK